MVRNPGKRGKPGRGTGRHFSRDLARPGGSEEPSGMWTEPRDRDEDDDEEDDEDEDEDEDSDEDEDEDDKKLSASTAQPSSSALKVGSTEDPDKPTSEKRAERKAAKKVGFKGGKGDDDDDDNEGDEDLDNPNRGLAKNMKASDLNAPRELSRREREQAEKAAAQARYQKMHAAGKTDEAQKDLARLRKIREERAKAAAEREAMAAAKKKEADEKLVALGKKKK